MLKYKSTLFALLFVISACSSLQPSHTSAKYYIEESYPYPWVDMSSGLWAIYDVDAPAVVAIDIENEAYQNFRDLLGTRLLNRNKLGNLLIDRTTETTVLDTLQLNEIAESSGLDYIILIKAKQGEESRYTERNHSYNRSDKDSKTFTRVENQEAYVNIKIYNLKKKELMFNRSCKAILNIEDKQAVHFSPSQQKMLMKAYQKLFKSLKSQVKT